jgi:hypothetical protein
VVVTGGSKSDPKAESQQIGGKPSSSGTTVSNSCVRSNEGGLKTVTGSLFANRDRLANRWTSSSRQTVAGGSTMLAPRIVESYVKETEDERHARGAL